MSQSGDRGCISSAVLARGTVARVFTRRCVVVHHYPNIPRRALPVSLSLSWFSVKERPEHGSGESATFYWESIVVQREPDFAQVFHRSLRPRGWEGVTSSRHAGIREPPCLRSVRFSPSYVLIDRTKETDHQFTRNTTDVQQHPPLIVATQNQRASFAFSRFANVYHVRQKIITAYNINDISMCLLVIFLIPLALETIHGKIALPVIVRAVLCIFNVRSN